MSNLLKQSKVSSALNSFANFFSYWNLEVFFIERSSVLLHCSPIISQIYYWKTFAFSGWFCTIFDSNIISSASTATFSDSDSNRCMKGSVNSSETEILKCGWVQKWRVFSIDRALLFFLRSENFEVLKNFYSDS